MIMNMSENLVALDIGTCTVHRYIAGKDYCPFCPHKVKVQMTSIKRDDKECYMLRRHDSRESLKSAKVESRVGQQ